MPWFFNTSQVIPIIDVYSYVGNLVVIFEKPKSVVVTDEIVIFRCVVAYLLFLHSRRLALKEVDVNTFCVGSKGEPLEV